MSSPAPLAVSSGMDTFAASIREAIDRYDLDLDEKTRLAESAARRREWRLRRGGKECSACRETKPVSAFGPDARRDGLRTICRACRRKAAEEITLTDERSHHGRV